jgi:hypothetical protein
MKKYGPADNITFYLISFSLLIAMIALFVISISYKEKMECYNFQMSAQTIANYEISDEQGDLCEYHGIWVRDKIDK